MPSPDYKVSDSSSASMRAFMDAMTKPTNPDLAYEIQELRKEISALREELAPIPSIILTGRQVLEE